MTAPLLEKLLVEKLPEQSLPGQLQPEALLQGEYLQEKLLPGKRITHVYPGHGDAMAPEMAMGLVRGV